MTTSPSSRSLAKRRTKSDSHADPYRDSNSDVTKSRAYGYANPSTERDSNSDTGGVWLFHFVAPYRGIS